MRSYLLIQIQLLSTHVNYSLKPPFRDYAAHPSHQNDYLVDKRHAYCSNVGEQCQASSTNSGSIIYFHHQVLLMIFVFENDAFEMWFSVEPKVVYWILTKSGIMLRLLGRNVETI